MNHRSFLFLIAAAALTSWPAAAQTAAPTASTTAPSAAATTTAPAASATPQAAAPAPAAAAQPAAVNAATYTRDVGALYADMTKEAQEFTAANVALIQSFKEKEADFQSQLDAVNNEIAEKSKDPAVMKQTHWWGGNPVLSPLKKQAKSLAKDLANARKETRRQTESVIQSMRAMEQKHLDAIKAKYKEVQGLVEAAENE